MSLGRVWWELRLLHSGTAGRGHGRCGHVTCPYLPVPMNLSAQNGDYLAIASTAECGGVGEKPLFLLPELTDADTSPPESPPPPPLANLSVSLSLYPSRSSAGLWHGALGTSDAVHGHESIFHSQQPQTGKGFGLSFITDLIHI